MDVGENEERTIITVYKRKEELSRSDQKQGLHNSRNVLKGVPALE